MPIHFTVTLIRILYLSSILAYIYIMSIVSSIINTYININIFVCMYFLASKQNEAHPLVIHWKCRQKNKKKRSVLI